MSPDEIRVRVLGLWRRRLERRLYFRAARGGNEKSTPHYDISRFLEAAVELVPGTRQADLRQLRSTFPEEFAVVSLRATSAADAILSGTWKLLGHPLDVQRNPVWHRDPRTAHCWPRAFYADICLGFDSDDGLDVKHVWELGRQQYLVELARAWLFTSDERFAHRTCEIILDWIVNNPLHEGVHWTSALEVAVRAISWLWVVATLAEWRGWKTHAIERIIGSLVDHARYLEHHLSFYSSPYNHLIGEATGLYLLSFALRQHPDSSRWRKIGRQTLCEYGPCQFYRDGFGVEQAVSYHFYTLGFLLMAVAASRTNEQPLAVLEPIGKLACRRGAVFQQPDGRWPSVGDTDSARSIPVAHADFWDFASICSLGAALFNDESLRSLSELAGEEIFWLLGIAGVKAWHQIAPSELPSCSVLDESGYVIARDGPDSLFFDAGPIAHGLHRDATPSTAHGHADTLQVLLCKDGRPVLHDPGMPFYFGDRSWVHHFRSIAAHNCIEVEGRALVESAGRLAWSHEARRPTLDAKLTEDTWLARGRLEWETGVIIERNLLRLPDGGLWIADWIVNNHACNVRWYWQLPANTLTNLASASETLWVAEGQGVLLAAWSSSSPLRAQIETAKENSPVAWNASEYGVVHAGQRICCEAEPATRLLVVTYIGQSPRPIEVSLHGQRIQCAWPRNQSDAPMAQTSCQAPIPEAQVIWRVQTESGLTTYAAGIAAEQIGEFGTALDGVGNWPVLTKHYASAELQESLMAHGHDQNRGDHSFHS